MNEEDKKLIKEALQECIIDLSSPFPGEAMAIAGLRSGDSSIEKARKALKRLEEM